MSVKLSILTPTLSDRSIWLEKLQFKLDWMRKRLPNPNDIEFLYAIDNYEKSTGAKRNDLVGRAKGSHVSFIDDDDDVTDDYLIEQLKVVDSGADCGSLIGLYFANGCYQRPFIHSKEYTVADLSPGNQLYNEQRFYRRSVNHLNCIRKDLIKDIPFQDKNFGEDGCWMEDIIKSGKIQTEYRIEKTLYLYYSRAK